MLDTLIKNGRICDGTGHKSFIADIGLKDGRIACMAKGLTLEASQIIDAHEKIIAPGFIDVHTHSDVGLFLDNREESQIRQGVTTELIGLCGYGFAPCTELSRKQLGALWGNMAPEGSWLSFADYLDAIAKIRPATNIAALVSHASLRFMTMKDNCDREATPSEIEGMQKILDVSLSEGGFGISTGLEYYPGKKSSLIELEKLCNIVEKHNGMHASHVRNRDKYALQGFNEVISVSRNTGCRLQISHINPKYGRAASTIRHTLEIINAARTDGVVIGMDVMPTNWNYTSCKALLPMWAHDLPADELLRLLDHPEGREKLKFDPSPIWKLVTDEKWGEIRHFFGKRTLKYAGRTIQDIADEMGHNGWDVICRLLAIEKEDMSALRLTSHAFSTEDILEVLQDSQCSACSDTIAAAVDGPLAALRIAPNSYTWCERFLRIFILEKKSLSLEEGIRRVTGLAADQIGLTARGYLKPGYWADIVVFDPETLNDDATIQNPNIYPRGIEKVFVNGHMAFDGSSTSSDQKGMVLRSKGN